MKRYIVRIAFLITLSFALGACESLLEEKVYSKITNRDIEDSDAGADLWVTGAYNGLNRFFIWQEFPRNLENDCDYASGPNWAFGETGAGNFQGAAREVDATWKLPYDLINVTNEAIYNIEQMKNVTPEHRNNCLGELKMIQAYCYFLIVRAYGPCPVFKKSINQGEHAHQPRSQLKDVYAHIIDLLTFAKDNLYKRGDSRLVEGRVCAAAAATLLAKVYVTIGAASMPDGATVYVKGGRPYTLAADGKTKILTNPQTLKISKRQVAGYEVFDSGEYYRLAKELATDIVLNKLYGNHALLPYDVLWKKAGRTNEEHFFRYTGKSGDDNLGALFPRWYSGQWAPEGYAIGGTLTWGLRSHWYKLFEEQDLRIVDGVFHRWVRQDEYKANRGGFYPDTPEWRLKATGKDENGDPVKGYPVAPFNDGRVYTNAIGENYLAYVTKYQDVSDPTLQRTDGMFPFLRYADALLILAEASNEVDGPNKTALDALNEVRTRSNASEKNLGSMEGGGLATKELFRSAVLEERAMELALESDRRWDLIRWGIYLDVMNAIGGPDEIGTSKARLERHLLYPIPQSEIQANEAINENNPGWN
ncbi:RagB/SusD family nutrient uptake outer membrane protein [Alistipes timonensis]